MLADGGGCAASAATLNLLPYGLTVSGRQAREKKCICGIPSVLMFADAHSVFALFNEILITHQPGIRKDRCNKPL